MPMTRVSSETTEAPAYKCLARIRAACAWPDCGCDPYATRVITALVDNGWTAPPECNRSTRTPAITGQGEAREAVAEWILRDRGMVNPSIESIKEYRGETWLKALDDADAVLALASSPTQVAGGVTDAMVHEACEAYGEVYRNDDKDMGDAMRAALKAALLLGDAQAAPGHAIRSTLEDIIAIYEWCSVDPVDRGYSALDNEIHRAKRLLAGPSVPSTHSGAPSDRQFDQDLADDAAVTSTHRSGEA